MAVSELMTDIIQDPTPGVGAGTNVSINRMFMSVAGNIAVYTFQFTTSAEIPAETGLLTNFKKTDNKTAFHGYACCLLYDHTASPKAIYEAYLTSTGELRCVENIPSGHSIRGSIAYVY